MRFISSNKTNILHNNGMRIALHSIVTYARTERHADILYIYFKIIWERSEAARRSISAVNKEVVLHGV